MKKLLIGLGIVAVVATAGIAVAAELHADERYVLGAGETLTGNAYLAGSEIVLLGTSSKDVSVAGGTIYSKGVIGSDFLAAGGEISIDGEIKGDARAAGGTINVSGLVEGDLAVAGGDVKLLPGSLVKGDVLIAGGRVTVDGVINGSLRLAGGDIDVGGEVKGGVWTMAETTTLNQTAIIGGDFTNRGRTEAVIMEGATIKGKIVFDPYPMPQRSGALGLSGLVGLFIATFGGLLLLWLFKNKTNNLVSHGLAHFGKELLRGFLALILVPIVAIVLCVTVIGLPFGFMAILLYLILFVYAKILSGIMLGGWINRVFFKKPDQVFTWQTVVGGNVVLFLLVQFVPFVGGIVSAIFLLLSLGTAWGYVHKHVWASR